MPPLVSIIIPAFNSEKYLGDTVRSALAQTWPNKEIIIVDDGSSDGTLAIANQFASRELKVLTQKNRGAASARNAGLAIAQGDFIQWLDADDLLAPDKISLQLADDLVGDQDLVHTCQYAKFHCYPETARKVSNALCHDLTAREWLLIAFSQGDWLGTATWLVNRKLTELSGPWDERLTPGVNDDGEYFSRVVSNSSGVKFHKKAQAYYRIGNPASLSRARSPKALESILLSVILSIDHLLRLENSHSGHKAALRFIQHCVDCYKIYDLQTWRKFEKRAKELGGELRLPAESWKFQAGRALLGETLTARVRATVEQTKWATARQRERIFSLFA